MDYDNVNITSNILQSYSPCSGFIHSLNYSFSQRL